MLFLRTNSHLRPKIYIGYIDDYYQYIKSTNACIYTLKTNNFSNWTSKSKIHLYNIPYCHKNESVKRDYTHLQGNDSFTHVSTYNRKFCANALPKSSNIFGQLSDEKYERIEMDEDEEIEEKSAEIGSIPKWQRVTYSEYCKLMKMHLEKKDLQLALNVLDVMKENRDKPSLYMYRLLLSAFSRQGDIRQCFKLFRKLKDRGFDVPPTVYTTLINACAESHDKEKALERLQQLRNHFFEKQVILNDIHYTTLIKAYGRHNDSATAFLLADEARDKGYCTPAIIGALFHATVSDKETGLKNALRLWHNMRLMGMRPNIMHYNLLLRTIRDSNLGNLKLHDMLVPESAVTQIQFSEVGRPDLLALPPMLTASLIPLIKKSNNIENNSHSEISISDKSALLSENLNNILQKNRLILFGGMEKFLDRMKSDGAAPNIKTLTLILDLLPDTIQAEEYFLKYIKEHKISVDMTFFNILIKRRNLRKQYYYAKAVLNEIQNYHLTPNILTFGVLAIGCTRHKDGVELLEQMDVIGYAPNYVILETLMLHACQYRDFNYILHLLHYVLQKRMTLSKNMLGTLDKFEQVILQLLDSKKYNYKKLNIIRTNYNQFKIKYETVKEKLQRG